MNPIWQTLLTSVFTAICSSGFMGIVLYKIQRRDHKKDEAEINKSAQSEMMLGLGHDKLLHLTNKFVRRGGITLKERTNLDYLYKPYERLGGNGDCKTGYDECQKLSTITDDDAEKRDALIKRKDYGITA